MGEQRLTKQEALAIGFCPQCAGYHYEKWLCGIWCGEKVYCLLPDDVRDRWAKDINQAKGKLDRWQNQRQRKKKKSS